MSKTSIKVKCGKVRKDGTCKLSLEGTKKQLDTIWEAIKHTNPVFTLQELLYQSRDTGNNLKETIVAAHILQVLKKSIKNKTI